MAKIKKVGITGICLVILLGIVSYLLWATGLSQQICDNLLDENMLNSPEQCHISWNRYEFIPAMFPIGVSQDYVEVGMQGFYLESDLKLTKLYLLRRTPPSRLTWFFSMQVAFSFDATGSLRTIEFEFF